MTEGTVPYCGPAPVPADLWLSWTLDPPLLVCLALALGLATVLPSGHRRRSALAAVVLAVLLFVSPLCALSSALFAARSTHHVISIAALAPLIAWSMPLRITPVNLVPPLGLSTLVLWLWHVPAIYEAAMASHALYWAMQAGLVAAFTWFWTAVLRGPGDPLQRLFAIGVGAGQMGLLGALLTFAPEPLYATHAVAPVAWGLTPLADQQLAGLLMWVPAFLLYGMLATAPARQLLREEPA